MDALNRVEVSQIRVRPLSEWNYLITKTPPRTCPWPRTSSLLCWWCCHAFSNVPAFLPVRTSVDVDKRTATIVFAGNFCSWNCVKRYALMLQDHRKEPSGSYYIGMLAFMTVCKGSPCEGPELHDLGLCECIDAYRGVRMSQGREVLTSFGGDVDIAEYRRGFHVITDYDKVQRHFGEWVDVKCQALASPHVKFWGFQYLHYAGPDASCTTYVNILPLTNRPFNRRTLVRTGNEAQDRATKLDEPERPKPVETTATGRPRGRPPRIARQRGGNHGNPQPVVSSSSPTTTSTPPRRSGRAMMTNEQVLSCNEEQQFYTNSLRNFGNIVTSMRIEITKPQSPKKLRNDPMK
jgi:hypothetical protein